MCIRDRYYSIPDKYKCENGEPTATAPPIVCDKDTPKLDEEFIEDDDDAYSINIFGYNVKMNTLFWINICQYILSLITIIGILISTYEFFTTWKGTKCITDVNKSKLGWYERFKNALKFWKKYENVDPPDVDPPDVNPSDVSS